MTGWEIVMLCFAGLIILCSLAGLVMFFQQLYRYLVVRGKVKRGEISFEDLNNSNEED